MTRFASNDAVGDHRTLLPWKDLDLGHTGRDPRLFMDVVIWIVRTGAQWRDLSDAFGNWNSAFKRLRRWMKADVFYRMFKTLAASLKKGFYIILIWGNMLLLLQNVYHGGNNENQGLRFDCGMFAFSLFWVG